MEAQIESLTARIAEARSDVMHLSATIRLFDTNADDKPTNVRHGATKALKQLEILALSKVTL